MNYEEEYQEEVNILNNISDRYDNIQETDILGAYNLMKDSIQAFLRWSKIRHDIRQLSTRGQNAAIKQRMEDICTYLIEINTESRMIWSRAKSDLKEGRY